MGNWVCGKCGANNTLDGGICTSCKSIRVESTAKQINIVTKEAEKIMGYLKIVGLTWLVLTIIGSLFLINTFGFTHTGISLVLSSLGTAFFVHSTTLALRYLTKK